METRTDTRVADAESLDVASPVDRLPALQLQTPPSVAALTRGPDPVDRVIALVQAGVTMDQIREILVMQREHEAHEAHKAFNRAFASFKAKAQSIVKSKHVEFTTRTGLTSYDHAELFDVVETLTPTLSEFGLSTSWSIPEQHRDWIVIECRLRHELGYSEAVRMGGPPDESGGKNAIQAISSAKTYLERQTMKAICGVAEKGTDHDGRDPAGPTSSRAQQEGRPQRQQQERQQEGNAAPTGLEADAEAEVAQGFAAYDRFWNSIGKDNRRALFGGHERRSEAARRVDQQQAGHTPRGEPRAPQQPSTGRSRPPAPRAAAPAAPGYR